MKWLALVLLLFCLQSFAAVEEFSSETLWPKDYSLGENQSITVYQPQVESLQRDMLSATSAFKFSKEGKDFYGSFKIQAKALVDKEADVVKISDIGVSDLQLPVGKIDSKILQTQIQNIFKSKEYQVSYQSLRANLDVQVVEADRPEPDLKNTEPHFIFTTQPSILVMISGDPVWGPVKGAAEVQRVVNTSALILHESGKDYYLWAVGRWYSSSQVVGSYKLSKEPTSKFVIIKDDLIKDNKVDAMTGVASDGTSIYPPGVIPGVYVSAQPAELLQSEGEPQYSAVSDTGLLYMSNSPNSIFLDSKTQDYYVLVTGRWFKSKSLKNGPWSYVPGKSLPADFAKIPVNSAVSEALVSVPGTPQAKEARIVSKIPQMAKVPRSLKPNNIQCDGQASWVAINGSSLLYAQNCNTPIIQVTGKQYYAVQDGVWFVSGSPLGPWEVASAVPSVIYKIPSSSPLYYVTYVHVYDSDANYVTVGYTPGYHGTFVSSDGTIVYGTGYVYPTYVTTAVWYPPPVTYGFGVGYGWGYGDGFFLGFAVGSVLAPWGWGYCCWRGPFIHHVRVTNIYRNWGPRAIVATPRGNVFTRPHREPEIFAGRNGQIFRRNPQGQWQQYQGPGTWDNVSRSSIGHLEELHQRRTSTFMRVPTGPSSVAVPNSMRSPGRTGSFQSGPHPQFLQGGMRAEHFHGEGFHRR